MELKPLIAILLAMVILGCVQTEYKPVTSSEHPISTPTLVQKSTPSLTSTSKPTQIPTTTKPVVTTQSVKPTPTSKPVTTASTLTPTIPTQTPTPVHTLTPTPFTFEFGKKYRAKVVRVIDGDTIDVLINGKTYRIRLLA